MSTFEPSRQQIQAETQRVNGQRTRLIEVANEFLNKKPADFDDKIGLELEDV